MTYAQAEEYMNGIQKFARKNTLDHTRDFLRLLGDPCQGMKIIHVAGTNGKGSTCNYLRALLRAKGYHVGMFISPHLVSMRERMVFDETIISEQEFVSCFETVLSVAKTGKINHPTFFEFLFLMAMVYYAEKQPDFIILETGLGGRLDATNVFEHPVMTIITEIGLDHQQYLGDTKEKIAGEKAGIIKPGCPVVYQNRDQVCAKVIEKKVREMGAKAYPVDKNSFLHRNIRNKGIDFSYKSLYDNYIDISLPTYAYYQEENATLAIRAFELLMAGEHVTPDFLKKSLKNVTWAGRMEAVAGNIYVDGAHNEDGIAAFLEAVPNVPLKSNGRRILLFSVVDDKAYENMIAHLIQSELFTVYIVTKLHDSRGLSDFDLRDLFLQAGVKECDVFSCNSVEKALQKAQIFSTQDDLVFCVGSLYLVGEMKALLGCDM